MNFGERKTEGGLEVIISSKYEASKKKAIEMIESKKYDLDEGDFWILKNKTSDGSAYLYTGLIISHNGCLKINDKIEEKMKFKPSCVTLDKEGYEDSLVFTYINDEQGIYEVGEISKSNYLQNKGRYPYAMAYKRLFDRVVLKNSKLAYAGIYSDSEAEEFKKEEIDYKKLLFEYLKQNEINTLDFSKEHKLTSSSTNEDFRRVYESL